MQSPMQPEIPAIDAANKFRLDSNPEARSYAGDHPFCFTSLAINVLESRDDSPIED